MRKLFALDFKRLLQSKTSIIITILAPLILVLLISLTIAPLYFSDVRLDYFHITVLNDDDSPRTQVVVDSLIDSDTMQNLIDVRFVDSLQEGQDSLKQGAVAFIHIPKGLQEELFAGGQVAVNYYGSEDKPLENALLLEAMVPGLDLVNYSQNAVNKLYFAIAPTDKQAAQKVFSETSATLFVHVAALDNLYTPSDVSPLSDILPVEFYAAALLALFVALGALPISRITSDDAKAGLIHRQLLMGSTSAKCFISRWLSGSLLLFIQYAVLSVALLAITGRLSYFAGNVLLMLGGGVLFCAFVSLVMMLVGLFSKSAAFVSLTLTVALAALGGLFVPTAYMPGLLKAVSAYTPFSPALKLSIAGMFNADVDNIAIYFIVLIVYIAVLLPIGMKRFARRGQ